MISNFEPIESAIEEAAIFYATEEAEELASKKPLSDHYKLVATAGLAIRKYRELTEAIDKLGEA